MAYIELQTVTIASGTALSPAVALGEKTLVGIVMPAGWDAASMTFQGAVDDATFGEVIDGSSGSAVALTVAAAQFIVVDPAKWRGVPAIKVRSGTSGSPVNQTANRTITLVTRTVY